MYRLKEELFVCANDEEVAPQMSTRLRGRGPVIGKYGAPCNAPENTMYSLSYINRELW